MTSTSTMTLTLRPVEPGAVPQNVPLGRLIAAWEQRAYQAARGAQDGAGPGGHALTALAIAAAAVDRLQAMRWVHVEISLRAGAPLQAVADAMGLDVEEVRVGYGMVVDRRLVEGKLTRAESEQLHRLLDDGPR